MTFETVSEFLFIFSQNFSKNCQHGILSQFFRKFLKALELDIHDLIHCIWSILIINMHIVKIKRSK